MATKGKRTRKLVDRKSYLSVKKLLTTNLSRQEVVNLTGYSIATVGRIAQTSNYEDMRSVLKAQSARAHNKRAEGSTQEQEPRPEVPDYSIDKPGQGNDEDYDGLALVRCLEQHNQLLATASEALVSMNNTLQSIDYVLSDTVSLLRKQYVEDDKVDEERQDGGSEHSSKRRTFWRKK